MERRSYSFPESNHPTHDNSILVDMPSDFAKREAVSERLRTSPNSRRRGVLPDAVMPVQRQGSRDHVNHHMTELPELREEEPQGADDGFREMHEHEPRNVLSHVPANVGRKSRRSSAPTILAPIQEGLLGHGRRNSTPSAMPIPHRREASLSPARCGDSPPARSPRLPNKFGYPMYGVTPEEDYAVHLHRRRRSEPDHHIKGLQANILYTTEGFFPQPRRNSLATSTLNDIASRFELLDTRRKVVEEGEHRGPAMPSGGSLSGLGCKGGATGGPPMSVAEAHY